MQETFDEFMDTINPRNYIIQEVLNTVNGFEIKPMNNYRKFEGFYLDIEEIKKNKYRFRIRGEFLKDIVNITFDNTGFVIKYSTKFFITTNKVTVGKDVIYKSNLVDKPFVKSDLSTLIGTEIQYDIDCAGLELALTFCEKIYHEIQQLRNSQ